MSAIGAERAWLLSKPSADDLEGGYHMASVRDKTGRPAVVVTGMGLITSLGTGKADYKVLREMIK